MQFCMLISRVRIYPGICANFDTIIDIYIDSCDDVATHPLYSQRDVPFQRGGEDRQRHRSMPVHRLVSEMAGGLNLEPESMLETQEDARGTALGRPLAGQERINNLDVTLDQIVSVNSLCIKSSYSFALF